MMARKTIKLPVVIGIQRETLNIWECRAPLGVKHVLELAKRGVDVVIQPSSRRSYSDQEYEAAGAKLSDDLSRATIIFGIKQPRISDLMSDKSYCFFSHTIKAQPENMQLLDVCMERRIRLMDYERLCDAETGRRSVAFGQFAGMAGMVDILNGIGIRLLALGHHTPFMHVAPAHNHSSTHQARMILRDVGYQIARGKMSRLLAPLVFVFTGAGNVSKGAQSMFQELPFEYVKPSELPNVAENGSRQKVYGCEVDCADHLERIGGGDFKMEEFIEHPERYDSTFARTVAPYASVIVNGIYWAPDSPRLITNKEAKLLFSRSAENQELFGIPQSLIGIADISADLGGSIEFMDKATTIDEPFCIYDVESNSMLSDISSPGILICSIDNMPAQFPTEATDFFGDQLFPLLPEILRSDAKKPFKGKDEDALGKVVAGCVITSNGCMTERFKYIDELRAKHH